MQFKSANNLQINDTFKINVNKIISPKQPKYKIKQIYVKMLKLSLTNLLKNSNCLFIKIEKFLMAKIPTYKLKYNYIS